ncbi:MAG TPA: hypothetical protein V6D21_19590 [Candidatus Obscuribacterales bacterium]
MALNQDIPPNWKPISELNAPAGYGASAKIQSNQPDSDSETNFDHLCNIAVEIRNDPLKMRLLADRIYQLMLEDLRWQKERSMNYRG